MAIRSRLISKMCKVQLTIFVLARAGYILYALPPTEQTWEPHPNKSNVKGDDAPLMTQETCIFVFLPSTAKGKRPFVKPRSAFENIPTKTHLLVVVDGRHWSKEDGHDHERIRWNDTHWTVQPEYTSGRVQFTDQNKSWDSRDGLHRFNIVRWIQLQNVRKARDIKRSHSEAEGDSWSGWVETEVPNTDSSGSRVIVPSQPFWLSTLTKWYGAGRSLWFSSCSLIMFDSSEIHGQKRQGFVEVAAFGRRPSHLALHQNSSTWREPRLEGCCHWMMPNPSCLVDITTPMGWQNALHVTTLAHSNKREILTISVYRLYRCIVTCWFQEMLARWH